VDCAPVEVGMELSAGRAGHAVDRPGVLVVGLGGEVGTGVDVVVPGRGHQLVFASIRLEVLGYAPRHGGAHGHGQAAAFAEVVLDVDDHKRLPAHRSSPPEASVAARSWSERSLFRASSNSCSPICAGQTTIPSSSATTRSPGPTETPAHSTWPFSRPPPVLVEALGEV